MRHLLLLLAAATLTQAYDAAPAVIILNDDSRTEAFITSETFAGVDFLLPDPVKKTANPNAGSSKSRGQFKRIEYGDAVNPQFKVAEAWFEKGELAKAVDHYSKALETATYQWVVERSYVQSITCLMHPKLNKPDDGLKLVDAFIAKFPKSIHLGMVTALRADLRLAKGDLAGAEQDYRLVEQNAEVWGFPASRGQLGLAETLKRAKKFPEAVKLLAPAFNAAKDPSSFSRLGLGLAEMQVAANQKDDAMKTLRRVALGPGEGPERGSAHLQLARLLADGAKGSVLANAFDHAVLAAKAGADDAVEQAARALARELAGRIDKDKSFSDEDRKEYRDYSRTF